MAVPVTRQFEVWRRGQVRDEIILQTLRNGLAELVDPETGELFTEERIRIATQVGSRDYISADAVDVLAMSQQSSAKFLADQVRPDRANTNFLREVWVPLYRLSPLPGIGGRGTVRWKATVGTVFAGSTTIPDPLGLAHTFRDPANNVYQVLVGGVVDASGEIVLQAQGVNIGTSTNIAPGTKLTAINKPLAAQPSLVVETQFQDGAFAENDNDLMLRLLDRIRYRPASGNDAHFRAWARETSILVETAFTYPTFAHAGSTMVVVLKKRQTNTGPYARLADTLLLEDVVARVTPPSSALVPGCVYVVGKTPTAVDSDVVLRLSMRRGSTTGWAAARPWPGYASAPAAVVSVASQTDFVINSDVELPGGASSLTGSDAPPIMIWNQAASRFERLFPTTIDDSPGAGNYRVQLSVAPATLTIVAGMRVSPYSSLHLFVAEAVEEYFDSLGPGEVINLATDPRADRAFRFPEPREVNPSEGGQAIVTPVNSALRTAGNAELVSMSVTDPGLPADVVLGPRMLTLGKLSLIDAD